MRRAAHRRIDGSLVYRPADVFTPPRSRVGVTRFTGHMHNDLATMGT